MEEPELKSLRELVTALVKDVKSVVQDVTSVKSALLGDAFNPVGYLKRLENVEKAMETFESNCETHKEEVEKYKNRILGGAAVIVVLWTIAVAGIGFYISIKF